MARKKAREKFRAGLNRAVTLARTLLEEEGTRCARKEYFSADRLRDSAIGAVYAFFDDQGECLYLAETGMGLRDRERKYPKPHLDEPWWSSWTYVVFLPNDRRGERELLERLLILAYQPKFHRQRGVRPVDKLFGKEPLFTKRGR